MVQIVCLGTGTKWDCVLTLLTYAEIVMKSIFFVPAHDMDLEQDKL